MCAHAPPSAAPVHLSVLLVIRLLAWELEDPGLNPCSAWFRVISDEKLCSESGTAELNLDLPHSRVIEFVMSLALSDITAPAKQHIWVKSHFGNNVPTSSMWQSLP